MEENSENQTTSAPMSSRTYDRLKYVAQVVLPAIGTLYAGVAVFWGLPYSIEVVGTISALDVFLGALLHQSSKAYNNSDAKYSGVAFPAMTEEGLKYVVDLQVHPAEVEGEEIILKKLPLREY